MYKEECNTLEYRRWLINYYEYNTISSARRLRGNKSGSFKIPLLTTHDWTLKIPAHNNAL